MSEQMMNHVPGKEPAPVANVTPALDIHFAYDPADEPTDEPSEDRVVEVSRNDALSLGVAAEAYRKMGLEPPAWIQQGADLLIATPSPAEQPTGPWRQLLRSLLSRPLPHEDEGAGTAGSGTLSR